MIMVIMMMMMMMVMAVVVVVVSGSLVQIARTAAWRYKTQRGEERESEGRRS